MRAAGGDQPGEEERPDIGAVGQGVHREHEGHGERDEPRDYRARLRVRASLEGDAERVVTGVAPLEAAGPGDVSFLTDPRYLKQAESSRAGAFLVGRNVSGLPAPLLRVDQPQHGLIAMLELFHPAPSVPPA